MQVLDLRVLGLEHSAGRSICEVSVPELTFYPAPKHCVRLACPGRSTVDARCDLSEQQPSPS